VRNLLIHAGIPKGKPEMSPTINVDIPDDDCFNFAEVDGLIEPMADLGDMVEKGQAAARIWPSDRTGIAPAIILARRSGLLTARHFPGLAKSGGCVAVIAVVV
jgi:N-alpha-acetyl-L-2,4-diaminobutyrate deacetylase